MSTNRAPASGVFGPYTPEKAFERAKVDVVHCARCRDAGRATPVVFGTDAIGRTTTRCPVCDGVKKPRKALPDEVFRPQALIGTAQLLPPCPPGRLRCQSCARPVEGDERLCVECQLPGLSKADRAKLQREREDREAATAAPRPRPTLPKPLFSHSVGVHREAPPKPARPKQKPDLARAVAQLERKPRRPANQNPWKGKPAASAQLRTCRKCGATSPYKAGPRELKECSVCTPKAPHPTVPHPKGPSPKGPHPMTLPDTDPRKIAWREKVSEGMTAVRASIVYARRLCAWVGCGETFQPTGPAAKYCEAHR